MFKTLCRKLLFAVNLWVTFGSRKGFFGSKLLTTKDVFYVLYFNTKKNFRPPEQVSVFVKLFIKF